MFPPSAADSPIVGKMAKIGIVPGKDFDVGELDPVVTKAMEQATKTGLEQILAETEHMGKTVNGWQMNLRENTARTIFRAAIAFMGLGANLPQDAVYPMASNGGNGERLSDADASRKWLFVLDHVQRRVFLC